MITAILCNAIGARLAIRRTCRGAANIVGARAATAFAGVHAGNAVGLAFAANIVGTRKAAALLRIVAEETIGLAHPAPAHAVVAEARTALAGIHAGRSIGLARPDSTHTVVALAAAAIAGHHAGSAVGCALTAVDAANRCDFTHAQRIP